MAGPADLLRLDAALQGAGALQRAGGPLVQGRAPVLPAHVDPAPPQPAHSVSTVLKAVETLYQKL